MLNIDPDNYKSALVKKKQFLMFLGVGIAGMIVDNTVLYGLTSFTDKHILFSKAVSAESSILLMFVLNNRLTYSEESQGIFRKFLNSNLVRAGGVAIAGATLYIANRYFGIPVILANTLGIGVGFVFNYMFETLFTWKTHRE